MTAQRWTKARSRNGLAVWFDRLYLTQFEHRGAGTLSTKDTVEQRADSQLESWLAGGTVDTGVCITHDAEKFEDAKPHERHVPDLPKREEKRPARVPLPPTADFSKGDPVMDCSDADHGYGLVCIADKNRGLYVQFGPGTNGCKRKPEEIRHASREEVLDYFADAEDNFDADDYEAGELIRFGIRMVEGWLNRNDPQGTVARMRVEEVLGTPVLDPTKEYKPEQVAALRLDTKQLVSIIPPGHDLMITLEGSIRLIRRNPTDHRGAKVTAGAIDEPGVKVVNCKFAAERAEVFNVTDVNPQIDASVLHCARNGNLYRVIYVGRTTVTYHRADCHTEGATEEASIRDFKAAFTPQILTLHGERLEAGQRWLDNDNELWEVKSTNDVNGEGRQAEPAALIERSDGMKARLSQPALGALHEGADAPHGVTHRNRTCSFQSRSNGPSTTPCQSGRTSPTGTITSTRMYTGGWSPRR